MARVIGINVRQFLRLAAVGDVQPVHLRRRELREQFAELLAEREVGFDLLVGLRVEVGQVHRVADFAGEQVAGDDFGDFDAAFLLRFVRAGAQMRREHDARMFAERMIRRQRFDRENVQRGAGDLAGIQRGDQIVFDDDFAAGAVHDAHVGLHLGERRGVQHAARLFRHRHVDGDEIRVAINRVQFGDQFDAERFARGLR